MSHLFSLLGPCNKPFSAGNSDIFILFGLPVHQAHKFGFNDKLHLKAVHFIVYFFYTSIIKNFFKETPPSPPPMRTYNHRIMNLKQWYKRNMMSVNQAHRHKINDYPVYLFRACEYLFSATYKKRHRSREHY